MADPLEPAVPQRKERTEAKSFAELREEYRAANLKRVRAMTRPDDLQIRDEAGNLVKRVDTGLRTSAPAGQDYRKMDEFAATGGEIPFDLEFTYAEGEEQFKTLPVPQAKLNDLSENAQHVLDQQGVRHLGNPSGDVSREGPALDSLDEESILAYTEANVTRECGVAGLAPHLKSAAPGGDDAPLQESGQQPVRENSGRSQTPEEGSGTGGGSGTGE